MKNLILILIFLIPVSQAFSQKDTDHTKWIQGPLKIDGSLNGWPEDLPRFDTKTRIAYGIANDRNYLYIAMIVPDEMMQRKIMIGGMEFRIDTAGEKKYPVCLFFPMPGRFTSDEKRQEPGLPNSAFNKNPDKRNRAELSQMSVSGFSKVPDGILPWKNENGIEVSLARDKQGSMIYEAAIPFKTFYKDELAAADSLKSFRFIFKIKGVPMKQMPKHDENTGGEGGQPGGQHQGEEMGEPGQGPGQTMGESDAIRVKLRLSYK